MLTSVIILIVVIDLYISIKKADEAKERYDQYFSKTYWIDKQLEDYERRMRG